MKSSVTALAPILALMAAQAIAGAATGWFGIRYRVETTGLFDRTVQSATIADIVPGSPAAASVLTPGDEILEVESLSVSGCDAKKLAAAMQKAPGATLRLRLRRPSGETYTVSLIASSRP